MQPKTIEAYAHGIRRLGERFDWRIGALTDEQLTEHFSRLLQTHSWSSVMALRCTVRGSRPCPSLQWRRSRPLPGLTEHPARRARPHAGRATCAISAVPLARDAPTLTPPATRLDGLVQQTD
ncbi:MAG: hypothetical protein L6Q73_18370 [Aquabacterium sp.]|nr:hypothetical protein [Aquabacterium sp.]